jgi:hypothetical protein
MKKTAIKKLRLNRETLRELTKSESQKAVGMSRISWWGCCTDDSTDTCDSCTDCEAC